MKECHDLVRAAVSNLTALLTNQDLVVATPLNIAEETSSSATSAARISHDVGAMKHLLYGIPEAPPDRVKAAELATEILRSELLEVLIVQLASLPFECRKDAAQVFSNLLRKHSSDEPSAATWLEARPPLLLELLRGCERPEVALACGAMLREAVRHERLAAQLLDEPSTFPLLCRWYCLRNSPILCSARSALSGSNSSRPHPFCQRVRICEQHRLAAL